MHWITNTLSALLSNEAMDIISLLENYTMQKVVHSDYQNRNGFRFKRIVFTYLDYLIYRDCYSYKGKEIIAPMEDITRMGNGKWTKGKSKIHRDEMFSILESNR